MSDTINQSFLKKVFAILVRKKTTLFCLLILSGYVLVAIFTKMGWLAHNWNEEVGASHEIPNLCNVFGTDILGRSVFSKVIHGCEVAMSVGFVVAVFSITIGVVFGVLAGYFGGIVDEIVVWLYTVIAAVPTMILLMVVAFMMGKGMGSIYAALIVAEWTETCRLVRGEVMRHKSREYIQAASAIGASNFRKLFIHILPNIMPLIIYQFSLVFQAAIKYEVILSYLGLGVQNKPSWGIMISDAKTELLRGIWWELFFATMAMFLLVLVFNIIADALRDALDPKLKGR
ncbi:ABC transporter permease [Cardinium endosymbiont of Culicoides punctatus]|uniref:ABC transporter permease n=1 Tax=Cardinium endosymbiont of Culicoides punctatus TaxID=2304601 RepID=UPI00105871DF|nr:ABC transporter permease [Cardinium endosymbiont of Culicoides punctatus]TDG95566.1 Dipeptide transport system permease protein DppC [Cardinium endosymbiont of Culicoides punctatus]